MESIKSNVLVDFNENQLREVRKNCNNYDVERLVQDINSFEEWIAKQNHFRVRKFDREYLERYLIYNKGSIERAKMHFDNLCTARNSLPEFLQDFELSQFEPIRSCHKLAIIRKPTADNYRIGISCLHGYHENMDIAKLYKYIIMMIEYLMVHDYCKGWVVIFDTRDMGYSMMTKMNPFVIGKAIALIVETMGQRMKCVHFLSGSKFVDTVVGLFKQAMSEKLASRVRVHETLESLLAETGREGLPVEYGGTGKSIQEFDDDVYKVLSSKEHVARMKFLASASTDESCRIKPKLNDGTAGSFKTMNID